MLGKTAGGLYWMFRYLERAENTARLISAGQRIALTRGAASADQWAAIVATAGVDQAYLDKHGSYDAANVVDFLLRDRENPSSVLSVIDGARNNARMVRTALTPEVWESVNETWMTLKDALSRKVAERDLNEALAVIRQRSGFVRGALHGSMARNDAYDFARIGTFIERADSTARILDVKYYVLLPSTVAVGTSMDNVQWEVILRSVSAEGAFRYLQGDSSAPRQIADFLILDRRLPRSLAFCVQKIAGNLDYLHKEYGVRHACHEASDQMVASFAKADIDQIFAHGLHEFLQEFINDNNALGGLIEADYRFSA